MIETVLRRWYDDQLMWSSWRYVSWFGEPKYSEKIRPSDTSCTTNPTRPYRGLNLDHLVVGLHWRTFWISPIRTAVKISVRHFYYCSFFPLTGSKQRMKSSIPEYPSIALYNHRCDELRSYVNKGWRRKYLVTFLVDILYMCIKAHTHTYIYIYNFIGFRNLVL
jgi:hypothetical protein